MCEHWTARRSQHFEFAKTLSRFAEKQGKKKKRQKETGHFSTFPCSPGHPVFPRRYLQSETLSTRSPLAAPEAQQPAPRCLCRFGRTVLTAAGLPSRARCSKGEKFQRRAGEEGWGALIRRGFASDAFCNGPSDSLIAT